MAKQKKKRNKKYTGADAAITQPTITRVTAVNRSKLRQWIYERRRFVRPVSIGVGVAIVVILILVELVHLLTA